MQVPQRKTTKNSKKKNFRKNRRLSHLNMRLFNAASKWDLEQKKQALVLYPTCDCYGEKGACHSKTNDCQGALEKFPSDLKTPAGVTHSSSFFSSLTSFFKYLNVYLRNEEGFELLSGDYYNLNTMNLMGFHLDDNIQTWRKKKDRARQVFMAKNVVA